MRKKDAEQIIWPRNISSKDRRFVREIWNYTQNFIASDLQNQGHYIPIAICCSGGIDSTVMAHIFAMTLKTFQPSKPVKKVLIYINHQLRSKKEIAVDIKHVETFGKQIGFETKVETVDIDVSSGNVQSLAREARYNALSDIIAVYYNGIGLLAHNANDNVETKLFQFLKGYTVKDLGELEWGGVRFKRPLLNLSRAAIERYADIWGLSWSEDSSNNTDKYARNRIRHDLIPWIEQNINPGIIDTLNLNKVKHG